MSYFKKLSFLPLGYFTATATATDYTYNSAGQLTAESYPNGAHVFYNYDPLGNLLERQVLAPRANPQADLSIVVSATPDPAAAGEVFVVTITVTNSGADTATAVAISDTVPIGLEAASVTSSQGAAEIVGGLLVADLGTIASGGSATVTLTGNASGAALAFNPTVSAPEDNNAANDTASFSVNVGPTQLADLSLAMEAGPNPVFTPGLLGLQAVVTNHGPTDSAATTLTLTLPAGASFESASHPATPAGNTVALDLGALASGASVTVTARINPSAGGNTVTAEVTTTQTDPEASNNTASASANRFAGTLVVTNTNNAGAGSLRQAIFDANNNPGLDIITFDIPGAGVPSIRPTSDLPILRGELVIDGFSQPAGLVEIDGSSLFGFFGILEVRGSEVALRGLVLNSHQRASGISTRANFAQDGVDFHETLSIVGCLIGTEPDGTTAAANTGDGIELDDIESVDIGGPAFWQRNLISGNGGRGIDLVSGTRRDIVIVNNYIGTDLTGTAALPNDDEGIRCRNIAEVKISGNVISANDSVGLDISGPGVVVQGNLIGTDATGMLALPNRVRGISVSPATDNDILIGGSFMGEGNVISGNRSSNVILRGGGVTLAGNLIGPDQAGTASLAPANSIHGIEFDTDGPTFIGLPVPGGGNTISGNTGNGIEADSENGHLICNNRIGTTADGLAPLPNDHGIFLNSASDNIIGGPGDHEGNLISGNTFDGIRLDFPGTTNTLIQGNAIGPAADGSPLGNGNSGIFNNNASSTRIEGNTIAHNTLHGANIRFGTATILGNSIHSNGVLGINLGFQPEVTPNDPDDGDTGANDFQNFPVITTAAGTASGTLSSLPNKTYRIEFFANRSADDSGHGEGETFLGALDTLTDGSGLASFNFAPATPLPVGQFITATATDPDGKTSEFGAAISIQQPGGFVDTDGDGMSDDFELANFGSETGGDPTADPDSDGQNNFAEFLALTDPNDGSSRFEATVTGVGGNVVIRVASEVGRVYQLEVSDDLLGFQPLGDPVAGNGDFIEFLDPTGTHRFYRLEVSLP